MMMFSMSLRFYSPKIQSALSISPKTEDISCASYLLTDQPFCSLDNGSTGEPELVSSDLVLRNASKMVILVGNPEQQNFRELLDGLLGSGRFLNRCSIDGAHCQSGYRCWLGSQSKAQLKASV